MADKKQPYVFLCYAKEDKPAVKEYYHRLLDDGFDVWIDEENLLPGQNWQLEITKAVENSDAIIVFLSSNSVIKQGFVQKEIKLALDVAEQKPEGEIFVIPAKLDECDVPRMLHNYHWANLFKSGGYEKVTQALLSQFRLMNPPNLRQKEIEKSNSSQVTIIIEKELLSFTDKEKDSFLFTVSKMTGISTDKIKILQVAEGSIKITLEMPEIGIKKLFEFYKIWGDEIRELGITKILKERIEKTIVLHQLPIFDNISLEIIELLEPLLEVYIFNEGTILDQGNQATHLYILVEGSVDIIYKPYNTPPITITNIKPTGIFGWSALTKGNYTSSAICREKVKTLRLRGDALRKFCAEHPEEGEIILDRLAETVASRWGNNTHEQVRNILTLGIKNSE